MPRFLRCAPIHWTMISAVSLFSSFGTAAPTSASSNTSMGVLPPSSRPKRLKRNAPATGCARRGLRRDDRYHRAMAPEKRVYSARAREDVIYYNELTDLADAIRTERCGPTGT